MDKQTYIKASHIERRLEHQKDLLQRYKDKGISDIWDVVSEIEYLEWLLETFAKGVDEL